MNTENGGPFLNQTSQSLEIHPAKQNLREILETNYQRNLFEGEFMARIKYYSKHLTILNDISSFCIVDSKLLNLFFHYHKKSCQKNCSETRNTKHVLFY